MNLDILSQDHIWNRMMEDGRFQSEYDCTMIVQYITRNIEITFNVLFPSKIVYSIKCIFNGVFEQNISVQLALEALGNKICFLLKPY